MVTIGPARDGWLMLAVSCRGACFIIVMCVQLQCLCQRSTSHQGKEYDVFWAISRVGLGILDAVCAPVSGRWVIIHTHSGIQHTDASFIQVLSMGTVYFCFGVVVEVEGGICEGTAGSILSYDQRYGILGGWFLGGSVAALAILLRAAGRVTAALRRGACAGRSMCRGPSFVLRSTRLLPLPLLPPPRLCPAGSIGSAATATATATVTAASATFAL